MKPRRMDIAADHVAVDDTYFRMCTCAQVHSWRVFGDSVYLLTRFYAFARRWKVKIKETAQLGRTAETP